MSNSNWWANRLGTPQAPAAPATPEYRPPVYQPQQSTPPTQQQAPYLSPELRDHRLPPSATNSSHCPGCGSGNYASDGQTKARCYDCGYPLQQSGSGVGKGIVGGPSPSGPATPARQLSTANNYNPQGIIGHI